MTQHKLTNAQLKQIAQQEVARVTERMARDTVKQIVPLLRQQAAEQVANALVTQVVTNSLARSLRDGLSEVLQKRGVDTQSPVARDAIKAWAELRARSLRQETK